MSRANPITEFETAIENFSECIRALDDGLFLAPLNNWSPRGVLAHLIGWNEYHIKGTDQILKGEEPFCESEHDENYCKVNADHSRRISSTDREELLEQLADSAKNLAEHTAAVPIEDYDRDFGSRYKDGEEGEEVLTVAGVFRETIEDINHHRVQIEDWAKAQRA